MIAVSQKNMLQNGKILSVRELLETPASEHGLYKFLKLVNLMF